LRTGNTARFGSGQRQSDDHATFEVVEGAVTGSQEGECFVILLCVFFVCKFRLGFYCSVVVVVFVVMKSSSFAFVFFFDNDV
jgi:hypothetical protein